MTPDQIHRRNPTAPKDRPSRIHVYMMRHGIAIDRENPDCPPETERYLTPKGIERTRSAAYGLLELGIKPTTLLTSPYVRAVQTAEIVCEVFDIDPKRLRATDALKPEAKPARLAEELSLSAGEDAMCFGHAPQLDDFIAFALRAPAPFTQLRKAGVACLEVDAFSPFHATLAWLATAKLLRHLAG